MSNSLPITGSRHFLRKILGPALIGCFDSRRDNLMLLLIVGTGLTLRLLSIDQPMRADDLAIRHRCAAA